MTWGEGTDELAIQAPEVLKYNKNVLKKYVKSVNGQERFCMHSISHH